MIILALDALDKNMVERFNCKNLMQLEYGETDISNFKLERTVALWASFLTGKNMENKIPIKGQWEFKLKESETLFNFFNSYKAIDVPAFSFKKNHGLERKLLKDYFKDECDVEEYDKVVWKHHEENKNVFLENLNNFKCLMCYFNLADAIGHLSFGVLDKMKMVYNELDAIAKIARKGNRFILIISDHGMKAVGRFGDHSKYGFYSCNQKLNLKKPKITDFFNLIKRMR